MKLKSKFIRFKIIIKNEHLLKTNESLCASFSYPKEVNALVKQVKAYKPSV